ncbi:redoxin domain-containing protein [Mesobacillus maritimus]|uniref:redoxin domain-containing protein n=1 Tax=Mesobacillus maritimus TaxID=1643336 RepID=UPI00384AFFF1
MIKKGLTVLLLLLLFAVALSQAMGNEDQNTNVATQEAITATVEVAGQAPNFTLSTLKGKEVKLSDFKGRKVMINFWATWCPPCKAEMPAMQQLYDHANGYMDILAINIDPKNDVSGFVRENQLTFPILLDESGKVNEDYSIISIPTTFLINEEGMIEKKHIGAMTLEQMEEFIIE